MKVRGGAFCMIDEGRKERKRRPATGSEKRTAVDVG